LRQLIAQGWQKLAEESFDVVIVYLGEHITEKLGFVFRQEIELALTHAMQFPKTSVYPSIQLLQVDVPGMQV
jgi:hypothetical protein